MKTKKSLGTKFLEHFIDYRQKDPEEFVMSVEDWLDKHKVPNSCDYVDADAHDGLIPQFFGQGYILYVRQEGPDDALLIGKGVCYDSGGYDLKPAMKDMHFDRNGALLAIASAIDLNIPARVFFVNNMLHTGKGVVSGEILTEPNTKLRVFIDDTDAEGRIGLAHLLAEAYKDGFRKAITMATLTGAAVQVTGERTRALVHSNWPSDYHNLMDISLDTGTLWPAPFHEDYDRAVDSKIVGADIRSCPDFKHAGSSTAFAFLSRFFDAHLIHLDMAAMMTTKDSNGLVWGIKEVGELVKQLH